MKGLRQHTSFFRKHAARAALALTVATTAGAATGCLERPIDTLEPRITATIVERLTQSSVDKIDILLAIDNSRSMADKQAILALAVPDLVKGIVNPRCVDENGVAAQMQPSFPTDACPSGTNREFEPVLDIHIGVISSSIGGHGADSCPDVDANSKECSPSPNTTNNDKGQLLARLDQCGGQEVPTYQNKKFLAWDPTQTKLSPPGEDVIDDGMGGGIVPALRDMVIGTGQIGCGYESQLESVYRFLADPHPYNSISVIDNKATPSPDDDAILLAQRAEFMRPDSLLAIIMLTDENDCSIKEYGQFYYVGQLRLGATNVRMPRARQECETDPFNECCKSCGQSPGNCPADPTCDNNGSTALLAPEEDDINMRCWDQKRRFGIDFLYPTDRYVQAFSSAEIPDRAGNLVPNPIFSDLNPSDTITNIRDPGLVFFAGIVGVPWQDIARDKTDLTKGFKDANELAAPIDASNITTWDVILGDPEKNVKPLDPLMIESIAKRTGTNPITGDVLVDATTPNANSINGHEWTIPNDDLQYACIFPLLPGEERDCTNSNLTACDCFEATNDNPLCAPDPNNSNAPTLQVRAKGYPGIRELSVLRDMGTQGIVASVCPAQLTNDTTTDFGYRPAIGAIIDRLKSVLGGQCLPRTLTPDPTKNNNVPCLILEARNTQNNCVCDPAKARLAIPPGDDKEKAVKLAQEDPAAKVQGWDCFCEIIQVEGDDRVACQTDTKNPPINTVTNQPVNGWCYVDPAADVTHNPEIVAKCPDNEKRIIRFVGEGEAETGATLFITCTGDTSGGG